MAARDGAVVGQAPAPGMLAHSVVGGDRLKPGSRPGGWDSGARRARGIAMFAKARRGDPYIKARQKRHRTCENGCEIIRCRPAAPGRELNSCHAELWPVMSPGPPRRAKSSVTPPATAPPPPLRNSTSAANSPDSPHSNRSPANKPPSPAHPLSPQPPAPHAATPESHPQARPKSDPDTPSYSPTTPHKSAPSASA